MNTTKAITDFNRETATGLGAIAQIINNKMTLNAATFTNPPLSMVDFAAQITDYNTKREAAASRDTAAVIAFNTARDLLEDSLRSLGNYVNATAKGDPAIVEKSGFPSYDTTRVPDYTPPGPPQDLRLTHGELSGSIVVRYKPEKRGSTNEIQINLGDPNDEAGWTQKLLIPGGKAELTGFPPGIVVWVRVRSVGLKGVMGVWSDPAQIRTL